MLLVPSSKASSTPVHVDLPTSRARDFFGWSGKNVKGGTLEGSQ